MTNYHLWPEISSCLNHIENEKRKLTKETVNLDTLTAVREGISQHVEQLQLSFEQELDKHFASLSIFAIVAYIDEKLQRHVLDLRQGNWAPLQKDFYGAYNAGELFYETIDKIIDDSQVPPIVPEVFYFILKKGFQGKYRDSKTQIAKYLEILKDKIPVAKEVNETSGLEAPSSRFKKKIKTWHYYAGAGVAPLLILAALYIASSMG